MTTPPDPTPAVAPIRLACLSRAPFNPYLDLLYSHLEAEGVHRVQGGGLSLRWLLTHRSAIDVLHVHWPEGLWRLHRGPAPLRPLLSWIKLVAFAVRLSLARLLGYTVAWTVHQVAPHERVGPGLDLVGARILATLSQVLVAHDETTAEDARRRLGAAGARVAIVPHGSYLGVYPGGRTRADVRRDLGISDGAFTFLAFGELRGYKSVGLLLDAFRATRLPEAALVVAGNPKDPVVAETLRAAAIADPRIRHRLGFVPAEGVAELFGACDAAVLARGDGGTSGSLILALSMGSPVVAADTRSYRELTGDGRAGWLFTPGSSSALTTALEAAARDTAISERAAASRSQAEHLDWGDAARRLAGLLRAAVTGTAR